MSKKGTVGGLAKPHLLRPPRLFKKPSTATSATPLSFTMTSFSHYPLLPKSKPKELKARSESSLCSTRSSSATLKPLSRCEVHPQLPSIDCSAAFWAVSNGKTGELLIGKHAQTPREIASLTKIMTCLLSVQLLKVLDGVSLDSLVVVSERAAKMCGTTAGLQTGDRLRIKDLLYALMLPSGNDAAQCLAEFFGYHLALRSGGDPTVRVDRYFVREMNELAQALDLTRTFFRNPHGMSTNKNLSTAKDVNSLSVFAMRSATFRSVVNCLRYTASVTDQDGCVHSVQWDNTNRLLQKGYEGVKTGSTGAAGPCLCASYSQGITRVIVTVLGARSMEERWNDVPVLTKYAMEMLSHDVKGALGRRKPSQDSNVLGSTVHVPKV